MHDNLCRTKNEPREVLTLGGESDEDDPGSEVVFTTCRESTVINSPASCEEQVQPSVVFTANCSASGLESTDRVSLLELQVEESAVGENSTCSSVKPGQHVEIWSSNSVQEDSDCETIDQLSKSELGQVGVITDHERHEIFVWFVETVNAKGAAFMSGKCSDFSGGCLAGDAVGWDQGADEGRPSGEHY